jgi:hypothetical protein
MDWEFVGKQSLQEVYERGKGHTYHTALWRAPVPGGWLLMALNSRTNDPQPVISFYPDPDHAWNPIEPAESANLLRPAAGTHSPLPESLLRSTHFIEED